MLKKITGFTTAARWIFWLLVLLSLPTTTTMAQTGASINGQALLATGKPAAFAQVRVCAYTGGGIPCSPLSSLFSDAALTQPVSNPYTSDQNGNYSVFATPGYYILQLTISGAGVYSYLISPSGPGSAGGVTSIKATGFTPLTGAVTIACGTGLSCTQSGQIITVGLTGSFTITSFTGCGGSFELGFSNTNPVCSATYSSTPASANITNTENIDSPLTLTTPFTSGTIVGTFTHSTVTTTTVTLAAIGSSTQTATQTMTWNPRIFGGIGAAGATSSVTASGTTAVLSTSDVLGSLQLGAETVGEVFGPFTGGGSKVYLLLKGGSHTFIDNGTGFPLPFNSPTAVSFVNVNGVTVSLFLYESTNGLFLPVSPRVAS